MIVFIFMSVSQNTATLSLQTANSSSGYQTQQQENKLGVTFQKLVLRVEDFHIFCTDWLCNVKIKIMIMSSVINRQLAAMESCRGWEGKLRPHFGLNQSAVRSAGALCNALKLSDPAEPAAAHSVHLKYCAASMQQRSIFEPKPQSQLNLSESHFCLNWK